MILLTSFLSLDTAQRLGLLLAGLEPAVAELGGCVDELELDVLQRIARRLREDGAPQGDHALLAARHSTLQSSDQAPSVYLL